MVIKPIVEGHGELKAVPELIRRICYEAGAYDVRVLQPTRAHRTDFEDRVRTQKLVHLARQSGPDGILILFDADDACPTEIAVEVRAWAREAADPISCDVVVANREYEAWLLGAMESLRGKSGIAGDAAPPANPEVIRDAKGEVSRRMGGGRTYAETVDQVALTAQMDLAVAHRSCRSFRKLVKDVGDLLAANDLAPAVWPPAGW